MGELRLGHRTKIQDSGFEAISRNAKSQSLSSFHLDKKFSRRKDGVLRMLISVTLDCIRFYCDIVT